MILVLLLLFVIGVTADHYSVLRVDRSAKDADIKKAFKKLARELHPDSAPNVEDKERRKKQFIQVSEAYEVLSDPKRRAAYDESGGRRSVSTGDDRNFLRYNLFADFNGVAAEQEVLEETLQKGTKHGAFATFFWSTNFPECIDAAPAYKQLAIKLGGTSISPTHFKCDDAPHICRQLVDTVPSMVLFQGRNRFRYDGKFEVQAMTEFVTRRMKTQIKTVPQTALEQCKAIDSAPFDLFRKCVRVDRTYEVLAFEYSPCFDCDSEMLLAVDTVRRSLPDLSVAKVACGKGSSRSALCKKFAEKNRAWSLVSLTETFYAFLDAKGLVNVHGPQLQFRKFDGRFFTVDFVAFIVSQRPTDAVTLNAARLRNLKKSNDSFAVLLHETPRNAVLTSEAIQWNLLASFVNRVQPYRTKRGRLRILSVNCLEATDVCRELTSANQRPTIAVFPFGTKAKTRPPVILTSVLGLGWTLMRQRILEEAEPLHLHVLTPSTYDAKVSKALASPKNAKVWVILYNAGQWCPPCNQIRPAWKEATRLIQKSPHAKKINVGLVECDEHKSLCNQLNIESYPTVVFLAKGRSRQEFGGNRDAKSIAEWATEMIDSRVVQMHPQALFQTIQNGGTILVSYTAGSWCPPCTQLGPIFKQASGLIGDVTATVVNCDDQQYFCQQQAIDGFPTIILYRNGQRHVYDQRDRKPDLIADFVKRHSS